MFQHVSLTFFHGLVALQKTLVGVGEETEDFANPLGSYAQQDTML